LHQPTAAAASQKKKKKQQRKKKKEQQQPEQPFGPQVPTAVDLLKVCVFHAQTAAAVCFSFLSVKQLDSLKLQRAEAVRKLTQRESRHQATTQQKAEEAVREAKDELKRVQLRSDRSAILALTVASLASLAELGACSLLARKIKAGSNALDGVKRALVGAVERQQLYNNDTARAMARFYDGAVSTSRHGAVSDLSTSIDNGFNKQRKDGKTFQLHFRSLRESVCFEIPNSNWSSPAFEQLRTARIRQKLLTAMLPLIDADGTDAKVFLLVCNFVCDC
jgi:hypothetical protein